MTHPWKTLGQIVKLVPLKPKHFYRKENLEVNSVSMDNKLA